MKVVKNNTISDLTHENLVDLFATALYGSSYLYAYYDDVFYNSLPDDKKQGDCLEDELADTLLNGGEIYIFDSYAEGELYGELQKKEIAESEDGCEDGKYTLTLKDIIEGLEHAANGTYKKYNEDEDYGETAFDYYAKDSSAFDLTEADILIQIILFNEVVYG